MAEAFGSQHTSTFPEFLSKTGISLLVSTYQAGKLIMLRHQDGILNTHFVNMEKPMGVALQENHLTIGSAFQVTHYYNMPDVAPKVEPINSHDSCYLPRETHITGNIDIHEMAFTDDKELWLVNTKMSCLCTLTAEHSIVPRWRPPFISAYDLTDRCHLNGLAMRNGQPVYVSALGTTDTSAGWRKNKAAGGMLMDIRNNKMIASGLSMPHSPRWYQNKLWVLESGAGSLATVNIDTGKLTTIVELPGFTRGLDFIGRYAIIGLSQVRETAVFAGLPLTERCQERHCGVYIVDIVEKQVIAYVIFSGDVQEIFSVQILPSSFPAILSMNDPLLRTSYSLPDEALNQLTKPDLSQIRLEEADSLLRQGKVKEAISAYVSLLIDFPSTPQARYNLGLIYLEDQQWQNAVYTLQQVTLEDPKNADAHNSLGLAWNGLKKWDKAKASFEQAITIDQQYAMAHVNRAFILLRQGHFKQGWKEFEWRWKVPGMKPLNCSQPLWQGEDISEKTLLVHTEQSDSDIIQFARFIPTLATHAKRLILLCPEPFRLFFKSIEGVDEVRLPDQIQVDSFDIYVPIMSLPFILEASLDSLSNNIPYWHILDEVVIPTLRSEKSLKVGLLWKTGTSLNNKNNSILAEDFLSLTDTKEIEFYSLQTELNKDELSLLKKKNIKNLDAELVSYAHAGAIIKQLDLIISVDTPIIHLSAALGRPTWVLLENNPSWCWMDGREDNPWYPQVRVFNQGDEDNWDKALKQVQSALSESKELIKAT